MLIGHRDPSHYHQETLPSNELILLSWPIYQNSHFFVGTGFHGWTPTQQSNKGGMEDVHNIVNEGIPAAVCKQPYL